MVSKNRYLFLKKNPNVEETVCKNPNCRKNFLRATVKRTRLPVGVRKKGSETCHKHCARVYNMYESKMRNREKYNSKDRNEKSVTTPKFPKNL